MTASTPTQSTILIVDDDPSIPMLVRMTLKQKLPDLEVLTAVNGEKGLDVLRHHRVDLLITDLNMPVMDGITLLSHVMEEFPQVPRVVMSSLGDGPRKYAEQTGVVTVLTKPLDMTRLAEQVETWLKECRTHSFIEHLRLASFIQLVGYDHKTCSMGVRDMDTGRIGMLFFHEGTLVDASAGKLVGSEAALLILCWREVQVWVHDHIPSTTDNIRTSLDWFLLEAARLSDEGGEEELAKRNQAVPTPKELRDNRPVEMTPPATVEATDETSQRQRNAQQSKSLIDEGTKAFRGRDYKLAKELWEQAKKMAPDNPVIRQNLSMVERCLALD